MSSFLIDSDLPKNSRFLCFKTSGVCSGRRVAQTRCLISTLTIIAIVGIALLSFGALALSHHFGNVSSIAQRMYRSCDLIAFNLGSDPLTIAVFSTVVGGSLFLASSLSLVNQLYRNPKKGDMKYVTTQ